MVNARPEVREVSSEAGPSDVAVIGMACRFPGAEGYEAFWKNLSQGRCEVREIPRERWDWRRCWGDPQAEPNKCNSRWGSFLERVDAFDAHFFNVSARDAEMLDPQQRIMLELAWACFEDAGLPPSRAWGSKTGVFVGSAILDYKELLEKEGVIEAQYAIGVAHSVISSRISHWFNLRGPSVPMDTACASSLYAIHWATRSLQRGECSMALAGGVNILLTPLRYISFAKMGILSPTGRCRSFDDAADGTVRGEGAGLVLLKRLSEALRDGDPIHGVIKGSAINHSGKTHTLSYPNPTAQAEVIREAWRDARISPDTVSYIEAHGTGTPKGDPLEFDGLRQAFGALGRDGSTAPAPRCGIGSVKTNLGHLESAAGIAGVVKVLLSMQHRALPALQGFERLNHRIALTGTPFYMVDRLQPWERPSGVDGRPVPLRAGVSSFGFAGTNAHVVLEEAPARPPRPALAGDGAPFHLICLSAKTLEALRNAAKDLAAWLEGPRANVRLCELSAALLATKERLAVRAAFLASDLDELRGKLGELEAGATGHGLWVGGAAEGQSTPAAEPARGLIDELSAGRGMAKEVFRAKLGALAELYVRGADVDFGGLSGGQPPRDLRLPTYPFARERHWVPMSESAAASKSAGAWVHPLLQANTSNLSAQRFTSTFDGHETFFDDHRVQGQRMLPAAAFLEMARAAAALSIAGARESAMEIRDVVFARPMAIAGGARRVEVSVAPQGDGEIGFEIASFADGGAEEAVVHCHGRVSTAVRAGVERLELEAIRAQCAARTLDREACYETLRRLGFEYGPSHRGLASVSLGDGQALAHLGLSSAPLVDGYALPVELLDSALQSALILLASSERAGLDGERPPLPFAVGELEIRGPCAAPMWVRVRVSPVHGHAEGIRSFDFDLCDERGDVRARVRRFAVRIAAGAPTFAPGIGRVMAELRWQEHASNPEAAPFSAAQRLVLLCEPEVGAAEKVAAQIPGARCVELASEERGIGDRVVRACGTALEEVRRILSSRPRAALVQAVFSGRGEQRLYAALGGLLRSAGRENPAFVGQAIELEQGVGGASAAALTECARIPLEGEVRYRAGVRLVARWRELEAAVPPPQSLWKDGGVYLITGGAGGLGLIMAEEIARGAKRAVFYLSGRSELAGPKVERLQTLEALGCRVIYSQVDVAQREAVEALIAQVRAEQGRLDGVIHAAGVLRDSFIIRKERRELEEVLAAKVHGALHLDEATRGLPLDFFILFSSVAGALGNAGQADYAAANAFLDAFAALRAELASSGQRRGRTLCIDWPLWREGGMRVDAAAERALRESLGMRAIETRDGVSALHRALGSGLERVLFMEGDLARIRRALAPPNAAPGANPMPGAEQRGMFEGAQERASLEEATELLRREISKVLKVEAARMDAAAPMESHGIDSIAVVQLTRQLERTFGPLPKTLFFEYKSIRELAGYFLESHRPRLQSALAGENGPGAPRPGTSGSVAEIQPPRSALKPLARRFAGAQPTPEPREALAPADIAVIGMAGRYPGARNLQEFWANLRDGKDCIREIPEGRWDHRRYFDADKNRRGKTYSKWGGFIDGVDEFDPLFFNISPREAELMDPQERLFLQCAYEALQDAGYTREALNGAARQRGSGGVGVFVGVMWEEYPLYGAQEQARGRNLALSGSPASIANRVSYFCDFCGPSMAVDTLCSSSLTAIHLACQSLQRGECAAALAGGVNVSIHPNKYLWLAAGRYVSSKGRCESFGEGGDGYVPGEGVGAVLLKPLARAEADGDLIYGVIKASAVNHGGKTNGFTVPSPVAQASVIGRALEQAGVDPRTISYVEAHGTGTSLGDPIEIAGLAKAFEARGASQKQFCAIGSAKSNIGHCEGAAGVAGLTKVLLQMKHRQRVPSLHSKSLNPNIEFERTPFFVQQELAAWERPVFASGGEPREHPRIAGISSFGAGGSNAHLIVQEYAEKPREAEASEAPSRAVILLSARDDDRLRESAKLLLGAIRGPALGECGLADIAFTLQVGREAMEERLAILASSADELAEKLQGYLEGKPGAEDLFRGRASSHGRAAQLGADEDMARTLEAWVQKQKLGQLLALWVEGLPFDWSKLQGSRQQRRARLPTYPFARERYWVPREEGEASNAPAPRRALLHPLLHENTSDLRAQRFTSTFTGREFFLRDHVVGGRKLLPGAAQLELARAAVSASSGAAVAENRVRMQGVVWTAPLEVEGEPVQVSIELVAEESGAIQFEIYSQREDGEGQRRVHSRGAATLAARAEAERLDLESLKARCSSGELTGAECYAAFEEMGIHYGPAHRGIERIHFGREEALAKLSLPVAREEVGGGWTLHPGVLDSAMQGAIGLFVQAGSGPSSGGRRLSAALPFLLEELDVVAETEASMWVHLQRVRAPRGGEGAHALDLDLCDDSGRLCVRLRGLLLRPAKRESALAPEPAAPVDLEGRGDEMETEMLAPVWELAAAELDRAVPVNEGRALVVGSECDRTRALRQSLPSPGFLEIRPGETVESLAEQCGAHGAIDSVLWVAPEVPSAGLSGPKLLEEQEVGVLHLFRLLKALLRAGYGARALNWTVITSRCARVLEGDPVDPTHAGVHGLVGAMAMEYPDWRIRLVDVDGECSAKDLAHLPAASDGKAWALRDGEWHQQRLIRVERGTPGKSLYEKGRVYVVIGGAGGLGEVWSEHVIRNYQARVVWIGRRPKDASIERKIARMAELGPAPRYLQADAGCLEALRGAYREIKREHSQIHGIVHSAIVLRDKSLANMDEEAFRAAFAAKADVCVQMAEVFGREPLDFALFFSSTQSLLSTTGQGNYAAGCTFKDAFALRLRREWTCPVKVMNWGYWGEHGVAATEAHRKRMARAGVGSIQPAEAMAAAEELLASALAQVAFLKVTRARMKVTAADEKLDLYPDAIPAVLRSLPSLVIAKDAAAIVEAAKTQEADEEGLLVELLRAQLEHSGVDWTSRRSSRRAPRCPDFYERWLDESARILADRRPQSGRSAQDPWIQWAEQKRGWLADPRRCARVELLETMLRALPEILKGQRRATEIMFSSAGFALLERGIYRGNAVADFFNEAAAAVIVAYVEERLRRDPAARIRILEVGAGTGASSGAIFATLEPYAPHIEEYCFSDVSKAFILRAEEEHAGKRPFLRAKLFDVEAAISGQGVAPGVYDLAVATNVLHATRDVRRSLLNVKAALKKNGLLVLNELSRWSLFGHLTFGLLEGWWSHRDSALRIPGCPGLSPESWRRVLEEVGFREVLFPASEAHEAGQQIVAAQSDGIVRQRLSAAISSRPASPWGTVMESSSAGRQSPATATRIAASSAMEQDALRERGREFLKSVAGEVLKVPPERIDSSAPLGRYGIDSILVVQLTNALRGAFGEVSSTLLFEHQSIDALVEEFLRSRRGSLEALARAQAPGAGPEGASTAMRPNGTAPLGRARRGARGAGEQAAPAALEGEREGDGQRVAIVGLAGRYPMANDVREFWRNLREGRHCISEVPRDRWDWRDYYGEEKGSWGTVYTKWGGFLEDIARFDPAFFHLSPREAARMDPQERQFLEVAYSSIEDAGYTPADLCSSRRVGVFVGVMNGHYGSGAAHWSIANRLSFALDFQGPSLAVDSACSSSLTAIHLAVESLRSGTSECAIAGGVNLIVDPIHFMKLAAGSMLSPGDRCRAFGEGADGIVDAEGVGAVVLKPLDRALADGDHVYAVIRGSMLNAGGRTHGYTVPNPSAQQSVVAQALRRAGISARAISYLEAHGTGTELGDPIEIAGLTRAFEQETKDRQYCAIGSAKSNIGHCESAAGIAGLTKVLLQLKHGQLAPSLHAKAPNPRIDFASTPFAVQQSLAEWKRPRLSIGGVLQEIPRTAGISSFGAGGANAHLVIQELFVGNEPAAAPRASGPALIVLSARTERDLREKARQLAAFVADGEIADEAALADAAYTLQVGREPMAERLGMVVGSAQQLREKLAAFAERGECPAGSRRGHAALARATERAPVEVTRAFPREDELEELLLSWVGGAAVDWQRLYGERQPRRVSLPTYPFSGERYWAPEFVQAPADDAARARNQSGAPVCDRLGNRSARAERSGAEGPSTPGLRSYALGDRDPKSRTNSTSSGAPTRLNSPSVARGAPAEAVQAPAEPMPAPRSESPVATLRSAAALRAELAASLAKVLYVQSGDVDVDEKFADMGLDSIIGVEWIRALGKQYGISIKPTAVYDHPNIRAFAGFLEEELARASEAQKGAPSHERSPEASVPVARANSLREVLMRVQQGALDVEDADRLYGELAASEAETAPNGAR
jgi:polyketide synthase PksM